MTMDVRTAVHQAMEKTRPKVSIGPDEGDEDVGEVEVSEYVIFLFALDTYMRYVEEATGEEPNDAVTARGIRILRIADSTLGEALKGFLDETMPSKSHKLMVAKALRTRVSQPEQVGRRSFLLRTAISRGGPKTMKAIFTKQKVIRQVRVAISASMMSDGDAALDEFAALLVRNARMRAWIDLAAKTAGTGEVIQNPVAAGASQAQDAAPELQAAQAKELGGSPEEVIEAKAEQTNKIAAVEREATEAAARAMEASGEEDRPLTKSEVIGVATAAAVAATTDTSNPANVPESLQPIANDAEQLAAALTDGRVLVAAGAGSGKSRTLVQRVAYLVKERGVEPSRILATTFNSKAGDELKIKIGKAAGNSEQQRMSVGTMHSLFLRNIMKYGSTEHKAAFSNRGKLDETPRVISRTIQSMWEECFDKETNPKPAAKEMKQLAESWVGNNISPEKAAAQARNRREEQAAVWYGMYEGLKGAVPGWEPECEKKAKESAENEYLDKMNQWENRGRRGYKPKKPETTFERFMAQHRPNGERLVDFNDMLSIFRDMLVDQPSLAQEIQKSFDHILVDECQDLNEVQNDVIEMMSKHVSDGSDGKSLWMVGDDDQSIYGFRGARPDLFTSLDGKEGWKTRLITTNYRCEPEIVDGANKLIANNDGRLGKEAKPSPKRERGQGSIVVEEPLDEQDAATRIVDRIKVSTRAGDEAFSDFAVLARTNKELHSYEAACLIKNIPYARKGASSFLGSWDVKAVMGYVDLVTGSDTEKMQESLASVINTPRRFFRLPGKAAGEAVKNAIREFAKVTGENIKSINPVDAMRQSRFREILMGKLAPSSRPGSFKFKKDMERLSEITEWIDEQQANSDSPDFKTTDLFDEILGLRGVAMVANSDTGRRSFGEQTFRESLQAFNKDRDGDEVEDESEDEEDENKGLGNITFLYELTKPDPDDPDDADTPPDTPAGFMGKMNRLEEKSGDLRIDADEWTKAQLRKDPDDRVPPPGVYLGTVHSVKGAQWKNVAVQMPAGKFPMEPFVKEGEPPPPEEEVKEQREQERRLGYVAMTRAMKNLTITCPSSIAGKPAGRSVFVAEAGFENGENINPPGSEGETPLREAATHLEPSPGAEQDELAHLEPEPDDDFEDEEVS